MTLLFSTALLGLAWFAAVNGAVSLVASPIARRCDRWRPAAGHTRARRLLLLRLTPFVSALLVAGVLFMPAHIQLEPREPGETFGAAVYALALMAVALIGRSAWRAGAVLSAGWRLRRWTGGALAISGSGRPGLFEVSWLRGISLAGVLRPRVLIGRSTRLALTPDELDVAVAHERAHERARDNLKRFVMFCAPDVFGATAAARRLEAEWRAEAERLADGAAARGDAHRAAALASALVKVARIEEDRGIPLGSAAWSTFHDAALLESRVRRLTGSIPPDAGPRSVLLPGTLAAGAIAAAWLAGTPAALHRLTELLVQTLP